MMAQLHSFRLELAYGSQKRLKVKPVNIVSNTTSDLSSGWREISVVIQPVLTSISEKFLKVGCWKILIIGSILAINAGTYDNSLEHQH